MNIDRRVTNGLAWAGVVLVVGVPLADMVSARVMGDGERVAMIAPAQVAPVPFPASQRPAAPVPEKAEVAVAPVAKPAAPTKPQAVAVAKPAATPAKSTDVVDAFVQSGKPLPSYITGAPAAPQVAATPPQAPANATRPTIVVDPIEVAALPPKVAPVPMPASMRPRPVVATAPTQDIVIPDSVVAPLPPANITAADLEDWESGPLSEFLARRQGGQQGSQASVTYDRDGFFLDEGPNAQPRPRRDQLVGPANGYYYLPVYE